MLCARHDIDGVTSIYLRATHKERLNQNSLKQGLMQYACSVQLGPLSTGTARHRHCEEAYVNAAPRAHIAQNDTLVIHLELVASRRDPIRVVHLQRYNSVSYAGLDMQGAYAMTTQAAWSRACMPVSAVLPASVRHKCSEQELQLVTLILQQLPALSCRLLRRTAAVLLCADPLLVMV